MKSGLLKILFVFFSVLTAIPVYSQVDSLNYGPEPVGGINALVLQYYKIDFTKEQRELLKGKEIEFIFTIDQEGVPTLEEINGIADKAILDSLQETSNKLPKFYPKTVAGVRESTFYFLKFQFPNYRVVESQIGYQNDIRYSEAKYEDFEYIHKSGERIDILFGGFTNTYFGQAGKYLSLGGGMQIDIMFIGKKGVGAGLLMNMSGNKLKQDYPINSSREQNNTPPTLMLGAGLSKIFLKRERSELNLQLELNYAIQNVTPRLDEHDEDWTQLWGVSPGLVGNYLIQLGKNKTYYYYGKPSIYNHYLNVHGAVRPVIYGLKAATGIMLEFGLSYRIGTHFVDEYKLKDNAE